MSEFVIDAIHGRINIKGFEGLIDSPEIQKLRRIKQLSFGHLVYPGANHTRFEHSLGVMHLSGLISEKLGLDKDLFMSAGLLHDVGHGPFGHASEELISFFGEKVHEKRVRRIIKNSGIRDVLKAKGLRINKVINLINGKGRFAEIISGDLDADRMDYLSRDAYYTGNAAGVINHNVLVNMLKKKNGRVVIKSKGLFVAEHFLLARYFMFRTVYYHHVPRIASAMMRKALMSVLKQGVISVQEFLRMDDCEVMNLLKRIPGLPGELCKRVMDRELFKRCAMIKASQARGVLKELNDLGSVEGFEDELAQRAGLKPGSVVVSMPETKECGVDILIETSGGVRNLSQVSKFVKNLVLAEKDALTIGVFTDKKNKKRVGKALKQLMKK